MKCLTEVYGESTVVTPDGKSRKKTKCIPIQLLPVCPTLRNPFETSVLYQFGKRCSYKGHASRDMMLIPGLVQLLTRQFIEISACSPSG